MLKMWEPFADVRVREEEDVTVSCRTADLVFEEGLRDGRWVSLSWNAAGYLMDANPIPRPPYLPWKGTVGAESFRLNVDGQDLISHWIYEGAQIKKEAGKTVCAVSLRHGIRPVRVRVMTALDTTPVLTRWLEVENLSDAPAALAALSPISGILQTARVPMPDHDVYRIGYFAGTHWGTEGDFRWKTLEEGIEVVAGRYRRDRHRHPEVFLENRVTGEMFACQLAYSAGYAFEFDLRSDEAGSTHEEKTTLCFDARLEGPAPLRVIGPGECFVSPEAHMTCVFGGLDMAVNAMHEHIRALMPPTRERTGWIETGIGPEYDMSRESTLDAVALAERYGSEVFFIDAGWYTPPGREDDWWKLCGDWTVNPERYPDGIAEIREAVHRKGMLFGMWMDAERVGPGSRFWQEHEQSIARGYDGRINERGLLDLTDRAVCAWVKEQIERLIGEYRADMFRLDHNVNNPWGNNVTERCGYLENASLRYYENVYRMFEELRREHPDVIFESCASGGARTDLGLVRHFTHTWVTDWQLHPNALRITNGMTMALPPECVDRLIGGQNAYLTADIDTQMRNLLFARPTVGGILPRDACPNPRQMERIRYYLELYKSFVRPMHRAMWCYHHTPELDGIAPKDTAVLELAAKDGSRGMLGVFRMADACEEKVIRARGADPAKNYRVTFDNDGAQVILTGFALTQGLRVRMPNALGSELILYESI